MNNYYDAILNERGADYAFKVAADDAGKLRAELAAANAKLARVRADFSKFIAAMELVHLETETITIAGSVIRKAAFLDVKQYRVAQPAPAQAEGES